MDDGKGKPMIDLAELKGLLEKASPGVESVGDYVNFGDVLTLIAEIKRLRKIEEAARDHVNSHHDDECPRLRCALQSDGVE